MPLAWLLPVRRLRRGLLLPASETGIAGADELLPKLLDPARRVDVLQLARIERMAGVADVDLQLRPGAASGEGVSAAAGDGAIHVLGMDFVFHVQISLITLTIVVCLPFDVASCKYIHKTGEFKSRLWCPMIQWPNSVIIGIIDC